VYPLTVTASNGVAADVSQAFTLTVEGPPVITSADRAEFVHGVAGEFTVSAGHGHPGAVSISLSGSLPAGLTFTDNGDGTATLVGTATAPVGDSVDVAVQASNTAGPGPIQTLTVEVVSAPVLTLPLFVPTSDGLLHGVPVTAQPGDPITVSGSGFAPLAPVTIGVYSTPRVLAVMTADPSGSFSATVSLPALTGKHTLVATGLAASGDTRVLSAGLVFSSGLPVTGGADPAPVTATGGLLVLAGLVLLILARIGPMVRRRRSQLS
jgi:hypothetical protein